jgi:pyridoxamine 5'-phosphate oxidase
MDRQELLNKLDHVLEDARAGILATTDSEGKPHIRWLTPTVLKGREGFLFAVTRPGSKKVKQLGENPQAEWMIQSRELNEIINIRGTIEIIDNPALKTEIMEVMGSRLTAFWKVDLDKTEFVVLETRIMEAIYYQPMTGSRERIRF